MAQNLAKRVFNDVDRVSWIWNEATGHWTPPTPAPEDWSSDGNSYEWNEETTSWDLQ